MSPSLSGTYPLAAVGKCVCLFGFACQVPQLVQRLPIHIPARPWRMAAGALLPSFLSLPHSGNDYLPSVSLSLSLPFTLCHFANETNGTAQSNEIRKRATIAYLYLRFHVLLLV